MKHSEIEIPTVNKIRGIQEKKFKKNFNMLLKKYLAEGHTKKDLAETIGTSQSTITNCVNGDIPKIEILKALSIVFDVSIDFLVGNEKSTKHTSEQILNMLGLSESAMLYLYCLKHDIQDIEDIQELGDLDIELPISSAYEELLETLNLLIADRKHLSYILNSMKYYKKKKQELLQLQKTNENNIFDSEQIFSLKRELRNTLEDIKELLQIHLDNTVELKEGE